MSDTPQLLALMQKTREMKAYDCVKEFESLARKLEKENIAFKKEIKSVLDALNTAANEGGFDGYDEDTPLLVNLKSHWDRLYLTYDKELQRLKRVNADLFAWKEGKKGIEEYYSMVSQRDAARAENAALREAAVEVCIIARVWVTVWGDKLSTESIQRFVELEKQILKEAQL